MMSISRWNVVLLVSYYTRNEFHICFNDEKLKNSNVVILFLHIQVKEFWRKYWLDRRDCQYHQNRKKNEVNLIFINEKVE